MSCNGSDLGPDHRSRATECHIRETGTSDHVASVTKDPVNGNAAWKQISTLPPPSKTKPVRPRTRPLSQPELQY